MWPGSWRRSSLELGWLLLLVLMPGFGAAEPSGTRQELVAVVELYSQTPQANSGEALFLTQAVRKAATQTLDELDPQRFSLMTIEMMNELLSREEREECLRSGGVAELGRRLSATYVIGGTLTSLDRELGVTIELYDTWSGKLLGSEPLIEKDVKRMLRSVDGAVRKLLHTPPFVPEAVPGPPPPDRGRLWELFAGIFARPTNNDVQVEDTADVERPPIRDNVPVVERVTPVYPELARRKRLTGHVEVELTCAADGRVLGVRWLSGDEVFRTSIEAAARRMRYAKQDSPFRLVQRFNFVLR